MRPIRETITCLGEDLRASLKKVLEMAKTAMAAPTYHKDGNHATKAALAHGIGAICAAEVWPRYSQIADSRLKTIMGADTSDANLGILSGTLVSQRTLELFDYQLDWFLQRVVRDYSDEPATLSQVLAIPLMVVPALMTYNPAIGAAGEPTGWNTTTPAQAVNATVTLDEHVGARILTDTNVLASTMRKLIEEQAPGAAYILAKHLSEKCYAKMTPANFGAYAAVVQLKVPTAFASYTVALNDFAGSSLCELDGIFTPNQVPTTDRTAVLTPLYHEKIASDPRFIAAFSARDDADKPSLNTAPKIGTFWPLCAPNLTATNATPNLVGFAMHRAAIIAAVRPPNDYTKFLPEAREASLGRVLQLTAQNGLTGLLIEHIDHSKGYASWRLCMIQGAGIGDNRGGLCILSK
ncbi:hypothetical protein SBV1_10004 [Verrucomicrobia bacterium]|nr:hypothetical protein SBV1_10004 [Verrucomicrobiota bacterium]